MNLMHVSRRRLSRCAAIAAAVAATTAGISMPALGTTGTWNADAADVWSNSTRWTGGIPTAAEDIANIQFNIGGNRTITIDGGVASRTVGTLTIGDITTQSHSFTVAASGGGTLTFNNGGAAAVLTQVSTSSGDTISAPIILADSLNVTNASNTSTRLLTLSSGGITAGTAGTKTITIMGSTSGGITFSGIIGKGSGDVAIIKGANNALTLSGANTFTGGVTLNAGTLNLNNASALGGTAGIFTIAGGTVSSTSGTAVTLSTNNPQSWNGNFSLGGTQSINFGTGAVTLGANRQVTVAGSGTYTVGGDIGGGFSLTTANGTANTITGTLVLGGTNGYTGGTTINGGAVRFTNAAAVPATGTITVGIGGALAIGSGSAFATPDAALSDGRLATTSAGSLALTSDIATDFSPGTSGYNSLGLGAAPGVTATYTGNYAPAGSTYRVGGGGGTIVFSNTNAFTGANNLLAGNGGGGTVSVTAANDYTGTTTVPNGVLQFTSIGDEGGGASALGNPGAGNGTIPLGVASGTSATLRFIGSASSVSNRGVNLLTAGTIDASGTGAATLTLNKPTVVTGTGNLTLAGTGEGSIAGLSHTGALIKNGAGTWTLTAANTFTGTTTISAGTLALSGGNDRLPTTSNVILGGGTLNVGNTSQTIADLSVVSATTFTSAINGAGGTLIVNGANDVELGPSTSANPLTINMAGLSNFTYQSPANIFRVGLQGTGASTGVTSQVATVTLGTNNSITAATLAVADVGGGSNPGAATLNLGQTNQLNANTFNIGSSGRSGATLKFAAGLTSPTATIRGTAGGSTPVASFLIGRIANNGNATWTSTADFAGGTVDALVTNMLIGNADTGSSTLRQGTLNASFVMGVGDVTVGTLRLGRIASGSSGTTTGTYAANGTFTMSDPASNLTAPTITFAENIITANTGTVRSVSGTFALNNGTLKTINVQLGAQTGTATSVTTAFNWMGGTVQNIDGADLTFTAIPITLSTAASHLFNITGSNTATIDVASPIGGTGAGISKSGTGALVLAGNNTYTGPTTITGGTLSIAAAQRIADTSAMTLAGGTFATGGFSETLAELSMTASSRIDMGSGASVLTFAASDLQAWTGALTIDNWSGDTAGMGTDRLIFGGGPTGLSTDQLAQITFTGFAPGAEILSTGEVVPVPEPTGMVAVAGLALGLLSRRRRAR